LISLAGFVSRYPASVRNWKKTLRAVLVRFVEIAGFVAGVSEARYLARESGLMLAMSGSLCSQSPKLLRSRR
jgi:hypothetical protein